MLNQAEEERIGKLEEAQESLEERLALIEEALAPKEKEDDDSNIR